MGGHPTWPSWRPLGGERGDLATKSSTKRSAKSSHRPRRTCKVWRFDSTRRRAARLDGRSAHPCVAAPRHRRRGALALGGAAARLAAYASRWRGGRACSRGAVVASSKEIISLGGTMLAFLAANCCRGGDAASAKRRRDFKKLAVVPQCPA